MFLYLQESNENQEQGSAGTSRKFDDFMLDRLTQKLELWIAEREQDDDQRVFCDFSINLDFPF